MSGSELKDMTRNERSLLLFFESASVEYGGLLNSQHMNSEDLAIAAEWASGFAGFRRLKAATIKKLNGRYTHCCSLSPTAWSLAQEERRERAARIRAKSPYIEDKG